MFGFLKKKLKKSIEKLSKDIDEEAEEGVEYREVEEDKPEPAKSKEKADKDKKNKETEKAKESETTETKIEEESENSNEIKDESEDDEKPKKKGFFSKIFGKKKQKDVDDFDKEFEEAAKEEKDKAQKEVEEEKQKKEESTKKEKIHTETEERKTEHKDKKEEEKKIEKEDSVEIEEKETELPLPSEIPDAPKLESEEQLKELEKVDELEEAELEKDKIETKIQEKKIEIEEEIQQVKGDIIEKHPKKEIKKEIEEIKKQEEVIEKLEEKKEKKEEEIKEIKQEIASEKTEHETKEKLEELPQSKQTKDAEEIYEELEQELEEDNKKEKKKKKGLFQRLTEKITTKKISEEKFESLFWDMEVVLLENNVAVDVIEKIKTDLKEDIVDQPIARSKILETIMKSLKESIESLFTVEKVDLIEKIKEKNKNGEPFVLCFVGVNGSGKTTTIAKIANLMKKNNLTPVLAAGDTFRAAAIDQLEEHANNLKVKIIKHDYGSDSAAVAFDAIKYAKAKNLDVVLIDTAGRQHSNANLMDELSKVIRVSKPDMTIFIGESITGNDCVEQAREFSKATQVNGIILSKADVDDKGGAAISVSYITKKPILYLGTGQGYDDLTEFNSELIIKGLELDV